MSEPIVHKLFNKKQDIISWLNKYYIDCYELVEDKVYDYIVNVHGDVSFYNEDLKFLPVKFNHIMGNFDISGNQLTSLYGGPKIVEGFFNCERNLLTNLEHSPTAVKDSFCCDSNKITSLKGMPRNIGGNLWLPFNALTHINVEDLPDIVEHEIFLQNNPLSADIINISNLQILKETLQSQQEHNLLTSLISAPNGDNKAFKL